MSSLAAETMTKQEVARITGLPRRLVSRACLFLHDPSLAEFDRDLAEVAPTFHAAMLNNPAPTVQRRFAVMVGAWRRANPEERVRFRMALERFDTGKIVRARGL